MNRILLLLLLLLSLSASAQIQSQTAGASTGGKETGATMFALHQIDKHETKVFNVNMRALPVKKLSFIAEKNFVGDLRIHMRRTYEFPTREYPKFSDAYAYFEINTVNFNPEFFSHMRLHFLVEDRWLEVRKLSPEDVSLYRLVDFKWQELPTSYFEDAGNSVMLLADTPSFSYFGIARSGLSETTEADMNGTASNVTNATENFTSYPGENITGNESGGEIIDEDSPSKDYGGLFLYWGIILVIMAFFYIMSRAFRKK